jgi:hypothetical protein
MNFKPTDELKALTWKQPYASLMLNGKVETRTWYTKYRGWVLICAGLSEYRHWDIVKISGVDQAERIMEWSQGNEKQIQDVKGIAFAIGMLVDCRRMLPEDEDKSYVCYNQDLFCHFYEHVSQIKPLSWKGSLGFSEVSEKIKNLVQVI